LRPGNFLVWEIYKMICNQFCQDFNIDVWKIMAWYQVKNPKRMLENLALIHDIARKNAKKVKTNG